MKVKMWDAQNNDIKKRAKMVLISHLSIIAIREFDVEMTSANIPTKIHYDYINNLDTVACLKDREI